MSNARSPRPERHSEVYERLLSRVASGELDPRALDRGLNSFLQINGPEYASGIANLSMRFLAGVLEAAGRDAAELFDEMAPVARELRPRAAGARPGGLGGLDPATDRLSPSRTRVAPDQRAPGRHGPGRERRAGSRDGRADRSSNGAGSRSRRASPGSPSSTSRCSPASTRRTPEFGMDYLRSVVTPCAGDRLDRAAWRARRVRRGPTRRRERRTGRHDDAVRDHRRASGGRHRSGVRSRGHDHPGPLRPRSGRGGAGDLLPPPHRRVRAGRDVRRRAPRAHGHRDGPRDPPSHPGQRAPIDRRHDRAQRTDRHHRHARPVPRRRRPRRASGGTSPRAWSRSRHSSRDDMRSAGDPRSHHAPARLRERRARCSATSTCSTPSSSASRRATPRSPIRSTGCSSRPRGRRSRTPATTPRRTTGRSASSAAASSAPTCTSCHQNPDALGYIDGMQLMVTNDKDHLCTQVSYRLNLRGPSVVVQTTCSTSLVAVAMACESLQVGRCDMALAGGVTVRVPQRGGYFYVAGSILSPDGHCRPFDANAQGTIVGSGVGLVVLKRLEDALADGDGIRRRDPRRRDQQRRQRQGRVHRARHPRPGGRHRRRVRRGRRSRPTPIGYVEAHGTGTILGDPIELSALTEVFREHTDRRGFCGIGSVKSNFGHLSCAAGVAGLIKTVLALEHGAIPPTLHYERRTRPSTSRPARSTSRPQLRAVVAQRHAAPRRSELVRCRRNERARRASRKRRLRRRPPTAGARCSSRSRRKSEAALDDATRRLGEHLDRHPEQDLADVAFTLHVGRRAFRHRRAVAVDRRRSQPRRGASSASRSSSRRPRSTTAPTGRLHVPGPGLAVPGHGRRALRDRSRRPRHDRRLLRDPPPRPRPRPARRAVPVRRSPRDRGRRAARHRPRAAGAVRRASTRSPSSGDPGEFGRRR